MTSTTSKTELQYRIINAAVDAVCDHIARIERAGARLIIAKTEALARVVNYALCEWSADVGEGEPAAEWERSADDVVKLLGETEWLSVALASRSSDGIVPVDWTAVDRQMPQAATAG